MNLQEQTNRIKQMMGVISETFIDVKDDEYSFTNHDNKKDKIDFNTNQLTINDGTINVGFNKVYLDGVEVASFVISQIGDIKDPHSKSIYPNSIFFRGGFIVKKEYHKMGIGSEIVNIIFRDTDYDNILLYAIDWQGAVNFWLKIGGEIIYRNDDNGLNLIKISNWYK
jgi:hypothetical protein